MAYLEFASGQDCLLQKPVRLCSLRQKVESLAESLSLNEQNCWFITCQTISSEDMLGIWDGVDWQRVRVWNRLHGAQGLFSHEAAVIDKAVEG